MRQLFLTLLLTIVLAPVAWAQDCKWCQLSIEPGNKVQWGGKHNFCSDGCRHEWYLDTHYRCKICNDQVQPKSSGGTRNVGGVIIIQITPGRWDGYCDFCREGVKNGTIDPVKDRYVPPKEEDGIAAQINAPAAVEPANPFADEDAEDADEDDGNNLKWILGGVVGLIFLIAKLLR